MIAAVRTVRIAVHDAVHPIRGAVGVFVLGLAARMHLTVTTIALTFLVTGWGASYAAAGTTIAGLAVGQGLSGPLMGRFVDRAPAAMVLPLTSSAYASGLLGLAFLPVPLRPWSPAVALAVGLLSAPGGQVARRTWATLRQGGQLDRVYRLDASGQEVLFILAPMTVATVASLLGSQAGVVAVAVIAAAGNIGLGLRVRKLGRVTALSDPATTTDGDKEQSVLMGRLFLVALTATFIAIMMINMVDLALVAWSRERGTPVLAGVLAALWAAGSLLGGVFTASGRWITPDLGRRLLWTALGVVALTAVLPPFLDRPSPVLVGAVLVAGGTTLAPMFGALYSAVAASAPAARRGEAFGWQTTATTVGAGCAAPLAGLLMDQGGPGTAVLIAALAVLAGALLTRLTWSNNSHSTSPSK